MNSQEQLDFLLRLGFTNNLARIYLALIKSGSCTAYQIAKSANLASEVVYRSMHKLQEMGVVQKIVRTPIEYQASPLDVSVPYLLRQKEKATADLKRQSSIFIKSFNSHIEEISKKEDFKILLIPESEQFIRFSKNTFSLVENSLDLVMTSQKFSNFTFSNYDVFKKLSDKEVNVRIVISGIGCGSPLQAVNDIIKNPHVKVRFISEEISACIGIYDEKEVIITSPTKADFASLPVYWSNIPCIIGLCKTYFNDCWQKNIRYTSKFPFNALITSRKSSVPLN
ncbi:MAG: hypothetical protein GX638_04645 [Crenarchaeota archaeon]|nr:hypothetical protein [Thermoproteota archaeon]